MSYDPETFAFYARNAKSYATRREKVSDTLHHFLAALPAAAEILELGCGAGLEARHMKDQGFRVTPTEGNPALAQEAEQNFGAPVAIMRFDELEAEHKFDAIWANMCLLHAPWETLDQIFARIHRALKPAGVLWASFKVGNGAQRDELGRYYNLPTRPALMQKLDGAAPWTRLDHRAGAGGVGADNQPYQSIWCIAKK
ncbi:class I SAM-dependent methyltransferase [Maritalea mediterranea]|uniref:Class I SAM-dependent methyltransferase n=1 Tax=Maritalea mediterranea TaxID=2909667 RepID=A0ABS9ED93_9HYPH|nr:class I SAM-dependent methyltransferase [Maritalea mediterranea]MCF4099378.1 class I SAM-dependent methyltransferase [Maritalea mediterranea]